MYDRTHHGGVYSLTLGELAEAQTAIGHATDESVICVDTDETARMLGVTPQLVSTWRRSGIGPRYFHVDPEQDRTMVLYPVQGLREWVADGVRKQQELDVERMARYKETKAKSAARTRAYYAKKRAERLAAKAASESDDKQGR